jgi:hypothetical protein
MLSIGALLMAVFILFSSMSGRTNDASSTLSDDPYAAAEIAAQAGIDAARWHIQCHGRTTRGGLGRKYFVNGATYEVRWDNVNMSDSTVAVNSAGVSSLNNGQEYRLQIESTIKLDFLPFRKNQILTEYYTREHPTIINVSAH